MKLSALTLLTVIAINISVCAQITNRTGIAEDYRNFMVQSTSSLNVKDLVTFEPIGGSDRFFSSTWETGGILNNKNIGFSKDYLFNYDYQSQSIYVKWKDTAVIVDNDFVNSFYINKDRRIHFFHKFVIADQTCFGELISTDTLKSKLRFVKMRIATIRKGDKASAGSNFVGDFSDKYITTIKYYLFYPDSSYKGVKLQKKSILEALSPAYINYAETTFMHVKSVNEDTVKQMIDRINEK